MSNHQNFSEHDRENIPLRNSNESGSPQENHAIFDLNGPYNFIYIIHLTLVISMGAFLFGYDTGIIGGSTLYFVNDFPEITHKDIESIVSLAISGALVGSVIMGPVSDMYGRKNAVIIGDILFSFGALLVIFIFFLWNNFDCFKKNFLDVFC